MRKQDSATGSGVAEKEEGWLKVPTMVRGSAGLERRGEVFGAGLVVGSDGRGSTEDAACAAAGLFLEAEFPA